jgi:hypothetical protein
MLLNCTCHWDGNLNSIALKAQPSPRFDVFVSYRADVSTDGISVLQDGSAYIGMDGALPLPPLVCMLVVVLPLPLLVHLLIKFEPSPAPALPVRHVPYSVFVTLDRHLLLDNNAQKSAVSVVIVLPALVCAGSELD